MTFGSAISVVVFAGLMLSVSLQLLAASGHFPAQARGAAMKRIASLVVLWLSIAVTLAAAIGGVLAGRQMLPWQALVIAGGIAILGAPLVLQQCPDRFVDGPRALLSFAAAAGICALLLVAARIA